MRNRSLRKKTMNKIIDSSVLAVFCTEKKSGKIKRARKSAKRKCQYRKSKLTDKKSRPDAYTIINIPSQLKNKFSERELYIEDNLVQLSRMPDEILDLTKYRYDNGIAPIDINNARYPESNVGQTHVNARKYTANHCCSIFNDKRQEYHIYDREDYNADSSDFNAEMRADWTAECFHPECIHAGKCRCFHDSSEYYLDINMQHDCCPLAPMRMAGVFKNSALPKRHQREEAERYESTDNTPEFSTNVYSPGREDRCANCDGGRGSSTNVIRKCFLSPRTSMCVELSESVVDLRNSRTASALSRCEIDTRFGKCGQRTTATTTTLVSRDDERPNKSDSLKTVDTWGARRDDRMERRRESRCVVVAESSLSDRSREKERGFARGMDSGWEQGSVETDVKQQLDYKWKRGIATVDCKEKCDSRSQTRSDNTNVDGKRRKTRDYSLWTSLQMGKIWLQVQDTCKNVAKLATSVGRVVRDASKSEHSQRNLVQVTDASLVKSSSLCADNICKETHDKNLSTKKERELVVRREREIEDSNDAEASMRQNPRLVTTSRHEMREQEHQNAKKEKNEKSCVFYTECDRYPDIVAFLPQTETYDHDENIHPQSHLSGSFKYLENSVDLRVRNRGGSDDGRDSMKSTADKQKSACHKESRSIRHHLNCASKKCTCCSRIRNSRECHVENQNLQHTALCYEPFVTADHQTIRAESDVFRNNPSHGEHQPSVSIPKDNEQRKMLEQIRFCEKMEVDENSECTGDAETERDLTSEIAEIAHATRVLSTNPTVHSSRNNPDEPIASTSKCETPLVSSGKSQNNHPGLKSAFCKTAMKFSRKRRPIANNKIIALFKRSRRNMRMKDPSNVTNHDNEINITQAEPSTVQITREGNKKRININVRQQTLDAIVARILLECLGETKKNVLMSITLESESDHDVLDRKEMETQTSLNDNTLAGTDEFNYSNRYPQGMISPTTKTMQCFVCDKQDCYEIIRSNNSITLEDALVTEYPETSELNDHFAKQKTDAIS